MKIIFFLLLLSSVTLSNAQTIEVLSKIDLPKDRNDTRFQFLNSSIGESKLKFVGTIRASGKDKTAQLHKLFYKIKEQAYLMGANSFKFYKYLKYPSRKEASLILHLYKTADSVLLKNESLREKNLIYIFLNDFMETESYTFYINDVDQVIKSGTYFRYGLRQGQTAEVKPGGFLASSWAFRWKKENPSIYITLTDFGQENTNVDYDYSGRFFNTKRINKIDPSLGQLMVRLMKESTP